MLSTWRPVEIDGIEPEVADLYWHVSPIAYPSARTVILVVHGLRSEKLLTYIDNDADLLLPRRHQVNSTFPKHQPPARRRNKLRSNETDKK